jgi:hypothetical protein
MARIGYVRVSILEQDFENGQGTSESFHERKRRGFPTAQAHKQSSNRALLPVDPQPSPSRGLIQQILLADRLSQQAVVLDETGDEFM